MAVNSARFRTVHIILRQQRESRRPSLSRWKPRPLAKTQPMNSRPCSDHPLFMNTPNVALRDEHEALTSIYGRDVIEISYDASHDVTNAVLTLPGIQHSFSLHFAGTYPDTPPSILGTYHVDQNAVRGDGEAAAEVLRHVLSDIYTPGQVCIFDLIEEAGPILRQRSTENHAATQDLTDDTNRSALSSDLSELRLTENSSTALSSIPAPQWTISEPLIVNKSTFVARVVSISDLDAAKSSVSHLLATNRRVASATHNITAWRIKQKPTGVSMHNEAHEIVIQDCDDDGETAAGGRLLHLMQLMDVWNVVVVVTRWYGGVKLGPDRFRCINSVAREAIVSGGFVKDETSKNIDKSRKKGKK